MIINFKTTNYWWNLYYIEQIIINYINYLGNVIKNTFTCKFRKDLQGIRMASADRWPLSKGYGHLGLGIESHTHNKKERALLIVWPLKCLAQYKVVSAICQFPDLASTSSWFWFPSEDFCFGFAERSFTPINAYYELLCVLCVVFPITLVLLFIIIILHCDCT